MAPKKILLLGATGEAGIATIQYALSSTRDVEILVYARSPAKIPEELRADSRVRILPGGELSDTAALRDAVAQKPDAIVSLLGPPPSEIGKWMNPWGAGKELVFANTYRVIVDAMKEFGVRRILVMGYDACCLPRPYPRFASWPLLTRENKAPSPLKTRRTRAPLAAV